MDEIKGESFNSAFVLLPPSLTLALILRLSACCRLSKPALQRSTNADRLAWSFLPAVGKQDR